MTSQALKESAAASPLQDVFQIYLQGCEALASPIQPFFKSYARANLEFWELASRRSRAAIELPAQIGSCLSPVQVVATYQSFLSSAVRDYSEAVSRASSVMSPVLALPAPAKTEVGLRAASVRPLYRDVMVVDPVTDDVEPQPVTRRYERHERAKQVA